jgi:phosphoglycolate phosphatase
MSSLQASTVRCVLFDLDGTLLDTAPDMGASLNALLAEQDRAPLEPQRIRPHVSNGSVALVRLGFPDVDAVQFERLRLRFLDLYAQRLHHQTRLFDGGHELLERLEAAGVPWGIVTNKPGWLTDPLLEHLALRRRAASVVSGDTLPQRKPDPAPMRHAADEIGVEPRHCVYLGDAERDMRAALAAGMRATCARYGYFETLPADQWGAELGFDSLGEFAHWLARGAPVPARGPDAVAAGPAGVSR